MHTCVWGASVVNCTLGTNLAPSGVCVCGGLILQRIPQTCASPPFSLISSISEYSPS